MRRHIFNRPLLLAAGSLIVISMTIGCKQLLADWVAFNTCTNFNTRCIEQDCVEVERYGLCGDNKQYNLIVQWTYVWGVCGNNEASDCDQSKSCETEFYLDPFFDSCASYNRSCIDATSPGYCISSRPHEDD